MHAHYSYPLLPELWEAQIIPNFSFVRNFDEYKALKQTCKFLKTIVDKTFPKELT